jgi:HEAT repeat protein
MQFRPRRSLGLFCVPYMQSSVMTSEHIDELFAKTLIGDYEDDAAWKAVHELRRVGSREVFEKAVEWSGSQNPVVRSRGLDVLAQIGKTADHPTHSFPDESFSVVSSVLRDEQEIQPLDSGIAALGHIGNPSGIPLIIQHQSHPDSNVRFSVACALGSFSNDPRSAECLLLLMKDEDEEIRDWATFGLGVQGDLDTVEIRAALIERLSDSNEDVRNEAMAGLGKRRDQRVLACLVAALAESEVSRPVIEAACSMLDMDVDREDWTTADYLSALQERFRLQYGQTVRS